MSFEEEEEELVEELLTAQQALILVIVVVAVALTYAYRQWKKMEAERADEAFLEYDFELPEEKEEFKRVAAQKPEETKENMQKLKQWHLALCQLLFKRVMKVIDLHEKVNNDYRTQMTLYKRGIAVTLLPQIEAAKKMVEMEVQECGALANQLRPNWGQTIFPEAYKMKEQMDQRNKEAEEQHKIAEQRKLEEEAIKAIQEKQKLQTEGKKEK